MLHFGWNGWAGIIPPSLRIFPNSFTIFVVSLRLYKSMVQINSPQIVQTQINQLNRISLQPALPGNHPKQPTPPLLSLLPEHILLLPEVAINLSPLAALIAEFGAFEGFVDEVAALSVEAVPVEHEGEAGTGLV